MPVVQPRLFKVGRTGLIGRQPPPARGTATLSTDVDTSKLGHVARRRIAAPPMAQVEAAVEAVGSALQAWSDRFIEAVLRSVPLHQDASVEQVYASLDDPKVAKATLESTFRAVDKASSDDLRVVGVRTGSVVSNADRLQSEWIERNTNLIKAQRDVVSRVQKVIAEAVPQGKSVADIRKLLEEQAGYARSRAELTARDQTLKLYGQIQQERQQAAGFTHYVWTTSLDERVREEHAELDGKVIAWDDPPVVDRRTGRREHPGGDYQCRCSAVPYTGDDVGEAEAPALETEPEVTFTARLPEQPDLQARAAEAAQARIARIAAPQVPAVPADVIREFKAAAPRTHLSQIPSPPTPVREALFAEADERFARLSPAQGAALQDFTSTSFKVFRALQQGLTDAEILQTVQLTTAAEIKNLRRRLPALASAQRGMRLDRPTARGPLYRGLGVSDDLLAKWLNGSEVDFKPLSNSTTFDIAIAKDFAKEAVISSREPMSKILLKINDVDQGAMAMFADNENAQELEVIVGRANFKIVGKSFDEASNTYVFDLVQVGSSRLDEADADRKLPIDFNRFTSNGEDLEVR